MSLTSRLDDPASPVARFIEFVGTTVSGTKRGDLFSTELKQLLGFDALSRRELVPSVAGANGGTVGAAFDYRLRYHLAQVDVQELIAWHGARRLRAECPPAARHVTWFFENLRDFTAVAPPGKGLADSDEGLLARYCVVLALLESVFRSSWRPELPRLTHERRSAPAEEPLLALASEAAVGDVFNLSRSAERVFAPVIAMVAAGVSPYHANPTFAGSRVVGGADADFVVGPIIYEVKTTKRPGATALREALQQLLGYVLLDYDDRYQIRGVGVYFPRQEWAGERPIWQIMVPPADVIRHALRGSEPSEAETVARLTKLRGLMRRVAQGEEIDYEAEFS